MYKFHRRFTGYYETDFTLSAFMIHLFISKDSSVDRRLSSSCVSFECINFDASAQSLDLVSGLNWSLAHRNTGYSRVHPIQVSDLPRGIAGIGHEAACSSEREARRHMLCEQMRTLSISDRWRV